MSAQPTTRRPRPARAEEPRTVFAPAFDRDAAALAFLADKHLISRQECRANLQRLGVELDDEEPRRLAVPAVVRREPPPREPVAVFAGDGEDEDDEDPEPGEERWWVEFDNAEEG